MMLLCRHGSELFWYTIICVLKQESIFLCMVRRVLKDMSNVFDSLCLFLPGALHSMLVCAMVVHQKMVTGLYLRMQQPAMLF